MSHTRVRVVGAQSVEWEYEHVHKEAQRKAGIAKFNDIVILLTNSDYYYVWGPWQWYSIRSAIQWHTTIAKTGCTSMGGDCYGAPSSILAIPVQWPGRSGHWQRVTRLFWLFAILNIIIVIIELPPKLKFEFDVQKNDNASPNNVVGLTLVTRKPRLGVS